MTDLKAWNTQVRISQLQVQMLYNTLAFNTIMKISYCHQLEPFSPSSYDDRSSLFFQQESFDALCNKPHNLLLNGWIKNIIDIAILFNSCNASSTQWYTSLSLFELIMWWTLLSCYIDQQVSGNHPDLTVREKKMKDRYISERSTKAGIQARLVCHDGWNNKLHTYK